MTIGYWIYIAIGIIDEAWSFTHIGFVTALENDVSGENGEIPWTKAFVCAELV